jgi:hypothetical protein
MTYICHFSFNYVSKKVKFRDIGKLFDFQLKGFLSEFFDNGL